MRTEVLDTEALWWNSAVTYCSRKNWLRSSTLYRRAMHEGHGLLYRVRGRAKTSVRMKSRADIVVLRGVFEWILARLTADFWQWLMDVGCVRRANAISGGVWSSRISSLIHWYRQWCNQDHFSSRIETLKVLTRKEHQLKKIQFQVYQRLYTGRAYMRNWYMPFNEVMHAIACITSLNGYIWCNILIMMSDFITTPHQKAVDYCCAVLLHGVASFQFRHNSSMII